MTKKARQVWKMILLIVGVSLFFALFVPNLMIRIETAKVCSCIARLKGLHEGIIKYPENHQGKYPEDLKELYPNYISDPKGFWCSSDKQEEPPTIDNSIIDAENSAQISYVYLKENILNASETSIILKENKPYHGKGVLGIGKDGTVFWISGERMESLRYDCNSIRGRWQILEWTGLEDVVKREKRSLIISVIVYVIIVSLIIILVLRDIKLGD